MALSTVESIRDQIYTLIESLTPASLTKDRFRRFRNEGAAKFEEAMEKAPAGALRRVQVREEGSDGLPHTSSVLEERVRTLLVARIAYPQTERYGKEAAMDRDDVMNQDWLKINAAIGIYGASNFTSTYDCIPLGATKTRESGDGVDFLVIEIEVEFLRQVA